MVESWKDQVCMAIKLLQQAWRRLIYMIQSLHFPCQIAHKDFDVEYTRGSCQSIFGSRPAASFMLMYSHTIGHRLARFPSTQVHCFPQTPLNCPNRRCLG
jgi:hypothetical protein